MTKEELFAQYPEYFSECFDFAIGDGWMPLVECLVERMDVMEEEIADTIACHEPREADGLEPWARQQLEKARERARLLAENPVRIRQVKEKFGGLRFYFYGGLPEYREWVWFAEDYSEGICEECGRRATHRTTGWIRNLCEEHYPKDVA